MLEDSSNFKQLSIERAKRTTKTGMLKTEQSRRLIKIKQNEKTFINLIVDSFDIASFIV
jgi:hypothetical protein